MGRPKSKMNEQPKEFIEDYHLMENPPGVPEDGGVVVTSYVPQMCRKIFHNGRDPGVALMFHYATKTHPLKHYTLYHGCEHELPVEVVEHLESCAEPRYSYRKNYEGHQEHFINGYKYIFQFRDAKRKAA